MVYTSARSMKIATVTLNPAIDQTVQLSHFAPNTVNRSEAIQFNAGGKGVNVASFLADSGLQVTATGFLGADNPQLFEKLLAEKHIIDRFIRIPGATRTNIKILDNHSQQTTDINQAGQAPPAQAFSDLRDALIQLSQDHEWFVLSGNLPPGTPVDIYAQLISLLHSLGRKTALDTSRAALIAGLQAKPSLAKPNLDELRQLTGMPLNNLTETVSAAAALQKNGIALVVVSLGADGAIFTDGEQTLLAVPPQVPLKTTVGAGDAMVAGIIAAKCRGLPLASCARLATAYSVAAITQIGTNLPDPDTVNAYQNQVRISLLE